MKNSLNLKGSWKGKKTKLISIRGIMKFYKGKYLMLRILKKGNNKWYISRKWI
jgi:hypothetical protein